MLDLLDVREAFRQRLLTLVVATTGTTTLGASTQGFTRTSGSFKDDGFAAGQEVIPSGFPGALNTVRVVADVSPTLLMIAGGLPSTSTAAGGRTLKVTHPAAIQWESTQTPYTERPGVRPYWYEQTAIGPQDSGADTYSLIADSGQYVLISYGLGNKGILAMARERKALRELFYPGLQMAVGENRDWVRVSSMQSGSLVPLDNGYVTATYRVLWRAVSGNELAA